MARTKSKAAVRLLTDAPPSEASDGFWIHAFRKVGAYPPPTERNGKRLVFVPTSAIDDVWQRIKRAVEDGLLGGSAKVSTRRPNRNASDADTHVICVYTYNGDDEADVRRVRESLRILGITHKLPWKSDEATYSGRYSNRGHRRISRYYE